jgi:hypothetical protein
MKWETVETARLSPRRPVAREPLQLKFQRRKRDIPKIENRHREPGAMRRGQHGAVTAKASRAAILAAASGAAIVTGGEMRGAGTYWHMEAVRAGLRRQSHP